LGGSGSRPGEPRRGPRCSRPGVHPPETHGRPDYLLYVDRKPVGAIEAKPEGTALTEVERQSSRYSEGLPEGITPPVLPLPFIYESTGTETRFTDLQDPECWRRRYSGPRRRDSLVMGAAS
jgi:type I restriction enzyme R subunit